MSRAITLPPIDEHDPTPKYLQAQKIVVDAIRSGELSPGAKLPSTKDISAQVSVSLITAHKALEALVASGWLRRETGRGTYVRQDVALTAASERSLSVAIVLDHHANINDYYHSTILEGLRQEARSGEQRVELFFQERLTLRSRERKGEIGAICIHPALEYQSEVEHLARNHPVLVLGGAFPNGSVSCVDCDNRSGGRQAVQHLFELGHRRILVVSGPTNLSNSRDRLDGAVAEIASSGLPTDTRDLIMSADSVVLDDASKQGLAARLGAADRPTAIVAGGFYLALAAIQVVRAAGLSIPQDVSVVGFDDPASAPLLDPPLTTIRQPLTEMSSRAYTLIRDALTSGDHRMPSSQLPTELVIRGSTAPA